LILDCDGVLVDSERLSVKIDVAVLRELGWPLSEAEVIERFMGRSDEAMQREIEAHLGRALPAEWEQQFDGLYRDVFEAELKPVNGVAQALDELEVPTCVASSGSHAKVRRSLMLTGLYERFQGRIFSSADVPNGKPAPDLFLHAARSMDASPEACAVVEDSRYGVEAARAAGMRVLAYAAGLTPRETLEGPDTIVFDDMRLLPALVRDL
jgi:HAD superfamily hydrolase (TIGR01509 family)